jgi:hypothetical protein
MNCGKRRKLIDGEFCKECLGDILDDLKKRGKKIKLDMTHCNKCKRKLNIGMTTELGDKELEEGKEPQILIVVGRCNKCRVMYVMNIIKIKDVPIYRRK